MGIGARRRQRVWLVEQDVSNIIFAPFFHSHSESSVQLMSSVAACKRFLMWKELHFVRLLFVDRISSWYLHVLSGSFRRRSKLGIACQYWPTGCWKPYGLPFNT
jgi:hypothetical protein